jgi:hypothetical protein
LTSDCGTDSLAPCTGGVAGEARVLAVGDGDGSGQAAEALNEIDILSDGSLIARREWQLYQERVASGEVFDSELHGLSLLFGEQEFGETARRKRDDHISTFSTTAHVLAERGLTEVPEEYWRAAYGRERQPGSRGVSYRKFSAGPTDQNTCRTCTIHAMIGAMEYHSNMMETELADAGSEPVRRAADVGHWVSCLKAGVSPVRTYVMGIELETAVSGTWQERAAAVYTVLQAIPGAEPKDFVVLRDNLGVVTHDTYAVRIKYWPFPFDSVSDFETHVAGIADAWEADSAPDSHFASGEGVADPSTRITWSSAACNEGLSSLVFVQYVYSMQQRRRERGLPAPMLTECDRSQRSCRSTYGSDLEECPGTETDFADKKLMPVLLSPLGRLQASDASGYSRIDSAFYISAKSTTYTSPTYYEKLMWALDTVGPFVAEISTCKRFQRTDDLVYSDTDRDCDLASPSGVDGRHNVVVDGYTYDGTKGFWLVRNSWGTTWGSEGYIMLPFGSCHLVRAVWPVMRRPGDIRSPLWPPIRESLFAIWRGSSVTMPVPGSRYVSAALLDGLAMRAVEVTVSPPDLSPITLSLSVTDKQGVAWTGDKVVVSDPESIVELPVPAGAGPVQSWDEAYVMTECGDECVEGAVATLSDASWRVDWEASDAYRAAAATDDSGAGMSAVTVVLIVVAVCVACTCCLAAVWVAVMVARRRSSSRLVSLTPSSSRRRINRRSHTPSSRGPPSSRM